jgi:hypothetical protein
MVLIVFFDTNPFPDFQLKFWVSLEMVRDRLFQIRLDLLEGEVTKLKAVQFGQRVAAQIFEAQIDETLFGELSHASSRRRFRGLKAVGGSVIMVRS